MNEASRLRGRWIAVIVALAVLLHVGATGVGWAGDDYVHLAMLEGNYPGSRAPWQLFVFFGRDPDELAQHLSFGTAPWWTVPEFHGAVFRPLASLSIWLDHTLFPGRPGIAHAHSLLWWGGAVGAAGLCLRRALPAPIAAVALVAFAADDAAAIPTAWLANRAVLMSALFSFLALWSHLRGHDEGWPAAPWVETGSWALALSAGEYAISGIAFVLAHALIVGRRRGRAATLRALAPAACCLLVFMGLHRALGYGTVGTAVYVDPFVEPLAFLSWAASRLPRMSAELLVGLPSNLGELATRVGFGWAFWLPEEPATEDLFRAAAGLGLAASAVAAIPVWLARRELAPELRRTVDWMVLGALLALIPVAAAPAHGRLLVLANLGASAAIAVVLAAGWRAAWTRGRRPGALVLAACALALAVVHAGIEPLAVVLEHRNFRHAHDRVQAALARPALEAVDLQDAHVILVAAPEPTTGIHGHLVLHTLGHAMPRAWHVLSMTGRPHVLSRRGPRTLELSGIGGPLLLEPPERFFRPADHPLELGERVVAGEMRATVLAVRDGGVDRVRFDFDRDLDDGSFVLLVASKDGLAPIAMPAVGVSAPIPIPRVPGLAAAPLPARW